MDVWEEHDVVFHYTTQAGLKGIVETQSLHATHYMFTNDSTEMVRLKPKLAQIILPIARKLYEERARQDPKIRAKMDAEGGPEALAQHDALSFADVVYRVTLGIDSSPKFFQPFAVSFCGHTEDYERKNGLLSQWRGYGKESGYAIVFDTKKLADLLKNECGERYLYDLWAMGDVIYDNTDEETFNKEFKGLIEAAKVDVPKLLKGKDGPFTDLNREFIASIPRYKHRGFSEEREVRMVVSPTDDAGVQMMKASGNFEKHKNKARKVIKFKETLAPYIVLFEDRDVRLPIVRIIVGPHRDIEVRRDKLRKFLELNGLEIDVSCSETPLV